MTASRNSKKFLDYDGLVQVLSELQNYPDNTILAAVIDAIQDSLDEKADITDIPSVEDYVQKTDLATQSTAGLMSAKDKQVLDNLNPNVSVTVSNLYQSEAHVINAKRENLIDLEITEQPHISSQIRTSNLLNVNDEEIVPGYLSSSGVLTASTNNNDNCGPFIPVTPGQDIYYTGTVGETTSSSINRRLHVYNENKTWIKQISFAGSLRIGDN